MAASSGSFASITPQNDVFANGCATMYQEIPESDYSVALGDAGGHFRSNARQLIERFANDLELRLDAGRAAANLPGNPRMPSRR